MNINRYLRLSWRSWLMATGLAVAALSITIAPVQKAEAADDYPNRPVTIFLPFGTGGVSDIVARLVAEHLSTAFGQRFLVENHPGADGAVGAQIAIRAGNKGYSLFNLGNAVTIRRTTRPDIPDDVERFEPVSPIAQFGLVIVTHPNSQFKTVQDIVSYAKANPGTMNIGSVSRGSTQNLAAELFKTVADIKATIVPFKRSTDVMGAVARKEVDIAFDMIAAAKSEITAGQIKPVATTQAKRSRIFPDVPTVEEGGVKPYDVSSWNCYTAPKGVPQPVVAKLNRELQRILALPDVQKRMLSFGIEPYIGGPELVSERFEKDSAKWRKVILDAGIPIKKK